MSLTDRTMDNQQPIIQPQFQEDLNFEQSSQDQKVIAKLGSQAKREQDQTGFNYVVSQLQHVIESKMELMEGKLMRKLQNIETRIYKIGLNFGSRLNEMEKKIYLINKSAPAPLRRRKVRKADEEETALLSRRKVRELDEEEESEERAPARQKNERVGDYYWTLDEEEKLQAVAAVRSGLKSKMQVALQYGKSLRTIKRWMTKYAD